MSKKPNILLIMTDEIKAAALGPYGNPQLPLPTLQRLADRGTLFEWAFCSHPLCVPSRVSFWTGRYGHNTGCRTNEVYLPDGVPHGAAL